MLARKMEREEEVKEGMRKKRKDKERALYSYPDRISGNQEKEFDHVVHSLWTTALRVQALHAKQNTTNKRYFEMKSQLGTEINESKYKEEMNAARKKQHDEEEKRKMRSKYKTAKLW